ncbi:MAG: hypothetical protein WBP42_14760 [Candidatus Zixiibacteriota bacterium]
MKLINEISPDQFFRDVSAAKTCVLLNSRQSRRPSARDNWVQATETTVHSLKDENYLFLTSIGQNTWELVLHLVNRLGYRQIIVVPQQLDEYGFSSPAELMSSFRLSPDRAQLFRLDSVDAETWPNRRDEFLAAHARVLVPISLRPDGNLAKLVARRPACVNDSFRAGYCKSVDSVHYDWRSMTFSRELSGEWDYLTHWTRSAQGPLLGQDRFSYYDSILKSSTFPGSAFHALLHILEENRIRASNRFIRGAYPVVSLTALRPPDALPLMRWRRRYGYYSFEPYGIAFRKVIAGSFGCREVRYGTIDEFKQMPEVDRPFFQNAGSEVADWRPEAEWRSLGDIDLNQIPVESVRVLAFRPDEACILRKICPYQVLSVCKD